MLLYFRIFWQLIRFQYYVSRGEFALLHRRVREYPISLQTTETAARVCQAVDNFCIWYPRCVLCLQRSAATTCVLRRYGIPAQMVIGVQRLPFRAHAWVECAGRAINDKPYVSEIYEAMERC
jgi:Transglutaminase-like superfamily